MDWVATFPWTAWQKSVEYAPCTRATPERLTCPLTGG